MKHNGLFEITKREIIQLYSTRNFRKNLRKLEQRLFDSSITNFHVHAFDYTDCLLMFYNFVIVRGTFLTNLYRRFYATFCSAVSRNILQKKKPNHKHSFP